MSWQTSAASLLLSGQIGPRRRVFATRLLVVDKAIVRQDGLAARRGEYPRPSHAHD